MSWTSDKLWEDSRAPGLCLAAGDLDTAPTSSSAVEWVVLVGRAGEAVALGAPGEPRMERLRRPFLLPLGLAVRAISARSKALPRSSPLTCRRSDRLFVPAPAAVGLSGPAAPGGSGAGPSDTAGPPFAAPEEAVWLPSA